ncbi:MetQ/NlpA family ABC transporter substrate-binding protein [Aerococcus urinaeequi]|uniref:MetQ/NlpA family ABC transporter substrate-binding protein n=1 Tax=Aerococcus urinaeequi TaxID=51665 RepID=UPI0028919C70|nr:MetQ/NlpA family ABC transporter substrate-binding protein [Aerococcus urinaeequi]MDT2762332.1 MetQ/NlpA family ABC transporter substrate-binding protein [Aerococcus urinaeequi]
MKKWTKGLLTVLGTATLALGACGNQASESTAISEDEATTSGLLEDGVLTIGVTAGPHEEIFELVKEKAAADGLDIELVVFNDYIAPNTALADGELDLNSIQTGPYLETVIEDTGYEFTKAFENITIPMGIYSEQYDTVDELQEGDTIAVPNTPSQEGRALLVLERAGMITLPEGLGIAATVDDIEENPLNLNFITGDPAQFIAQLPDVAAAGINSNYILDAGLSAEELAIAMEDPEDTTWVNWVVSRTEDAEDPVIAQLEEYYKTDEVKTFIEETFKGAVVASW